MKKILSVFILLFASLITTGAGYMGTLPNIDAEFQYLKEEVSDKTQAPFSVEELDEQNAKELKPIPRENDDYVDIIIKKDKTSKYMNDVSKVIAILHKLRQCITNNSIKFLNILIIINTLS